jgi:hypothetical protein
MEQFGIPFVLWINDEAPPSLTAMTAPVAIAVAFHCDSAATLQGEANTGQRAVTTLSEGAHG